MTGGARMTNMSVRNDCSISTYALLEIPLQDAVLQLIEEGWKAIEIMGEGRHDELLDWSEDRLAWLKQVGEVNGIRWTIHAPITGCNPAATDANSVRASQELLLRTMQIAEYLDCTYIVLHAGELDGESGSLALPDEAAQRVAAFLQAVLQATDGSEVVIALENVPPYPGLLGVDTEFLEHVLRLVAKPRIRIVFDAGHAHLIGEGQCLLSLQCVMAEVISVHLSDNHGEHDDHLQLGTGSVPLEQLVATLQQFGYSGVLVLEMRNMPDALASADWLNQHHSVGKLFA